MSSIIVVSPAFQSAAPETPEWRLILENIPLDPAAIVLYLVLGGSIWLVWWANRHSGARGPRPADTSPAEPGPSEEAPAPDPKTSGRGPKTAGRATRRGRAA